MFILDLPSKSDNHFTMNVVTLLNVHLPSAISRMIISYYEASLSDHGISFSSEASRDNGILFMSCYKLISFFHEGTGEDEVLTDVTWNEIVEEAEGEIRTTTVLDYPMINLEIKDREKHREIIVLGNVTWSFPLSLSTTRYVIQCGGCEAKMSDTRRILCTSCKSLDHLILPKTISTEKLRLPEVIEGTTMLVAWKKCKFSLKLMEYQFSNVKEEQEAIRNRVDLLTRSDIIKNEEEKEDMEIDLSVNDEMESEEEEGNKER